MPSPIIQFDALTKVFGKGKNSKTAVHALQLEIEPHQVYGFLGMNGAGKSTTIRMMLGLTRPTSGRTLIFDTDTQRHPQVLKRVGSIVEGATFYPFLSGWENLQVVGNAQGGFKPDTADQLMGVMGLTHAKKLKFHGYSTGMKQRLGMAAALMHDPDLVILDEPTNGMDPGGIREMRRFIRDLAHQHGKTVFLTSHLLNEVQVVCDRLAIIHQGQIIREGKLEDLLDQRAMLDADVNPIERAESVLNETWQTERLPDSKLLRIHAERKDTPAIVRRLVAENIEVFSISPYHQSLEEYFLREVKIEV